MADSETDPSDDEEYFPDGEAQSSSSCSDVSDEEFKPVVRRSGRRASVDSKKRAAKTGRRKRSITTRRKGGIKLRKEESGEEEEEEEKEQEEEEDVEEEEEKVTEDTSEKKEKERIDEIWAMFKNDVGNKSDSTLATPTATTAVDTDKRVSSDSSKTVTITKKYDYAGEDVTVEEEVPKDSKEAQHYLQSTSATATTGSSKQCEETTTVTTSSPTSQEPKLGVKRLSGLSAVLSSINKKPKMSTLEKSKLDWTKFKKEEGLQDELSFHNKDGYLAKQEFLQRTEQREFERDRDERLKRMRRLH